MKVSDDYLKDLGAGAVSFHDDAGNLKSIHYMDVSSPDGTAPDFRDAVSGQETLKVWFHKVAMPTWFLAASDDSRVLAETVSSFKGTDALLALVEIPHGSHLLVTTAGKSRRLDSRRGLAVVFRDQYIYMFVIETPVRTLWEVAAPEPSDVGDDWMHFVTELEPFYETINFLGTNPDTSAGSRTADFDQSEELERRQAAVSSVSPAELDAAMRKLGREGDSADLKGLLERGLDVNARDGKGRTPLMAAASAGDGEVLRLLLERGGDVNARNEGDSTGLMFAVLAGHVDVVRLLLEAGADVNVHNEHGFTALMASESGDPAVMGMLIAAGADIEARDNSGATALIGAAINGYLPAVQTLLEAGAAVNVRNDDGETALSLARKQGHKKIVKLLRDADAEE
jgi:hypothetical protein